MCENGCVVVRNETHQDRTLCTPVYTTLHCTAFCLCLALHLLVCLHCTRCLPLLPPLGWAGELFCRRLHCHPPYLQKMGSDAWQWPRQAWVVAVVVGERWGWEWVAWRVEHGMKIMSSISSSLSGGKSLIIIIIIHVSIHQ